MDEWAKAEAKLWQPVGAVDGIDLAEFARRVFNRRRVAYREAGIFYWQDLERELWLGVLEDRALEHPSGDPPETVAKRWADRIAARGRRKAKNGRTYPASETFEGRAVSDYFYSSGSDGGEDTAGDNGTVYPESLRAKTNPDHMDGGGFIKVWRLPGLRPELLTFAQWLGKALGDWRRLYVRAWCRISEETDDRTREHYARTGKLEIARSQCADQPYTPKAGRGKGDDPVIRSVKRFEKKFSGRGVNIA